jgi:hypothetical protein
MNGAVQIPGRLFALVNQFPFATAPVRAVDFSRVEGRNEMPPSTVKSMSRAGRCNDLDNEP